MASLAFASDFVEASRLEHGYETHEPVARRVFVNRVSLDDPRAARARMLDGFAEHALRQASASVLLEHKEADNGPDAFVRAGVAHQSTVRRSQCNRAPG